MQSVNLTNHFLIAMPNMADPHFAKSLTFICEHNEHGALGVVVNRPTEMTLATLFEQVEIPLKNDELSDLPVYFGGPVQVDRGFVLHRPVGPWQSTLEVDGAVGLTTSRDILAAVAKGEGPRKALFALGYAGWGAGQLEREMAENAWLSGPADQRILFDTPHDKRWEAAAALLGVAFERLSGEAGHA